MTIDFEALSKAIYRAKIAAITASEGEDGGTCNLDSPTIYLPHQRKARIEALAGETGVGMWQWAGRSGVWIISVPGRGQGNARTRGAEAARDALRAAGFEAGMYYQMD